MSPYNQKFYRNNTTGSGKFVLAATEHLELELAKLEARRHALEDALAIAHAAESDEPHHLLLPQGDEHDVDENEQGSVTPNPEPQSKTEDEIENLANTIGTLYVGSEGAVRFFGPSGGSESLLLRSSEQQSPSLSRFDHLPELDSSYLPPEILHCINSFPLSPNIPTQSILTSILSFLPSIERAIALCDTFLEHLSWMFHIVSRQEVVERLIPAVYKQKDIPYGPHQLSLILVVMGIGALVDLQLEPYNLEAQHYYLLARAALVLQPVLTQASIVTVKAVHLMSIYNGMSGKESNLERSYALLNLAGQIATRIGVHVDPSMWNFQGRELYERRVYFWNLLSATLWQSLVTGRPPAILSNYIDCKIPTAEEEDKFQQGEVPLGFGIWGFQASTACLLPVVRATLGTKPPPYEGVLELEQKIRQFVTPPADAQAQSEGTAQSMRRFVRSHYQDLMLLYLHRAFFLQAMTDYPENPLLSPYGKSVTTAYHSACVILDDTRSQYTKTPLLTARVWRIWSFAFAAAVVVGTVAMKGLHLNLQPPALDTLRMTCNVFRKAASINSRAAKALPVLEMILRKALDAQRTYQGKTQNQIVIPTLASASASPVAPPNHEKDEMSVIVGRPTVIYSRKDESKSASSSPRSRDQSTPSRIQDAAAPSTLPADSLLSQPLTNMPSSNEPSSSPTPYSSLSTYSHADGSFSNPYQSCPATTSTSSQSDLSEGWESLFHETSSGPIYQHRLNYHDFHPAGGGQRYESGYSHSQRQTREGFGSVDTAGYQAHGHGPSYNLDASYNDRWMSFMNYSDVMESFGSAQPHQ
ncbi:hypothetical protein PQX77_009269 [Marasmius sp. AFHP31]|nr:hypothetical protein PQX77_009269 [Marasmius sp. AFHP31]